MARHCRRAGPLRGLKVQPPSMQKILVILHEAAIKVNEIATSTGGAQAFCGVKSWRGAQGCQVTRELGRAVFSCSLAPDANHSARKAYTACLRPCTLDGVRGLVYFRSCPLPQEPHRRKARYVPRRPDIAPVHKAHFRQHFRPRPGRDAGATARRVQKIEPRRFKLLNGKRPVEVSQSPSAVHSRARTRVIKPRCRGAPGCASSVASPAGRGSGRADT